MRWNEVEGAREVGLVYLSPRSPARALKSCVCIYLAGMGIVGCRARTRDICCWRHIYEMPREGGIGGMPVNPS